MNETQLSDKNFYPSKINLIDDNNQENMESFTISVEEAAKILGVNRSRLSQLTSKGVFPYEKRKIETRNRLFYRLNDLLQHQRAQMLGNAYEFIQTHNAENTFRSPSMREINIDLLQENLEQEKKQLRIPYKHSKKNQTLLKSCATALFEQEKKLENDKKILADIESIKQKMFAHEENLSSQNEFFKKEEFKKQQEIRENNYSINKLKYAIFTLQNKLTEISQENNELKELLKKNMINIQKSKNWSQKKPKYRVSRSTTCR
ncbi:helix-turn-helix domain-containing protein [Fluviispira vulneris]|uniref:helix-turn-helix domain-containing protein n=1 Tax=Fluviispira vulneris TaxID=2763012 RepID=UPI00164970A9|nr:helix-turn-helix domain-containing protein [Fluviispira vulneris]